MHSPFASATPRPLADGRGLAEEGQHCAPRPKGGRGKAPGEGPRATGLHPGAGGTSKGLPGKGAASGFSSLTSSVQLSGAAGAAPSPGKGGVDGGAGAAAGVPVAQNANS